MACVPGGLTHCGGSVLLPWSLVPCVPLLNHQLCSCIPPPFSFHKSMSAIWNTSFYVLTPSVFGGGKTAILECINASFFSLWQMHPPKFPYLLTVITHPMCLNIVAFLFVPLIHTVAFAADMKSKVWCKGFRSINVVLWIVDWHVSKYTLPKNFCFSTVVLYHSRRICCLLSRITSLFYVDQ